MDYSLNTPVLPIRLQFSEGKLTGFTVTDFGKEGLTILCLENQAEFLVPYEQARYISDQTFQWMENYYDRGIPYRISLREDGTFLDD